MKLTSFWMESFYPILSTPLFYLLLERRVEKGTDIPTTVIWGGLLSLVDVGTHFNLRNRQWNLIHNLTLVQDTKFP